MNDDIQKVDFASKSVIQSSDVGDVQNSIKPILEEILVLTRTLSNNSAIFEKIGELLTDRLNNTAERIERIVRPSFPNRRSLATSPARISKKDMVQLSDKWIDFRHLWQTLLPDLEAARRDDSIVIIGIHKELVEKLDIAVRNYESALLSMIDRI